MSLEKIEQITEQENEKSLTMRIPIPSAPRRRRSANVIIMARQVRPVICLEITKNKGFARTRADGLAASIGRNSTLLAVPEFTRNYGTRDKQKIPRDKIAIYFGCRGH